MEQTTLEWLDVSFSNATTTDLKSLGRFKAIERLSVEGTAVDNQLLDSIRLLPKLSELGSNRLRNRRCRAEEAYQVTAVEHSMARKDARDR